MTKKRRLSGLTGTLAALTGVLALTYVNMNRLSRAGGRLASSLSGEDLLYNWRGWKITYNKEGEGPPLVMLHGIYATASNFEMRRIFGLFSENFTVYAPDLIGFGRSSRPSFDYSDKFYIEFLRDFIKDVAGSGAWVIASSLTAAYAIEIAAREPALIKKLVLIAPTGLTSLSAPRTQAERIEYRVLRAPLVGDSFFFALTSFMGLRYFLETMVYFDRSFVTDSLVEYQYRVSHQPGARWAAIAFVTGRLNHSVRQSFPLLDIPILIVRGAQSVFAPISEMEEFIALNRRAEFKQIDNSGSLVQDERAVAFHSYVRDWLTGDAWTKRLA